MAVDMPNDADTIEHSRQWLEENRDEGVSCPSCSQFVKLYRRKINSGMVNALATMYAKAGTKEYVHTPSLVRSHEVGQLVWWGFIEEEPKEREDGGRAGYWKVTEAGEAWLYGRTDAPKYALVYNKTVLEMTEDDRVRIGDVRTKGFDLRELLSS